MFSRILSKLSIAIRSGTQKAKVYDRKNPKKKVIAFTIYKVKYTKLFRNVNTHPVVLKAFSISSISFGFNFSIASITIFAFFLNAFPTDALSKTASTTSTEMLNQS